jgi:hypothetical protein
VLDWWGQQRLIIRLLAHRILHLGVNLVELIPDAALKQTLLCAQPFFSVIIQPIGRCAVIPAKAGIQFYANY